MTAQAARATSAFPTGSDPSLLFQLLEAIGDSVIVVDLACRIVALNAAAERAFDYGKTELVGRPFGLLISDTDRASYDRHLEMLVSEIPPARTHSPSGVRGRRKDGTEFDAEISFSRTEHPDRNFLIGILRDVSERKRQERELQESHRHLRQAQELAGLATWEQDIETGKLKLTRLSYEMFGVDPATHDPSSEVFLAKVHPEDREKLRAEILSMIATHSTLASCDLRVSPGDGRERVLQLQCELEWGDDGRPLRLIGSTQDITARFVADERLRRSERLLNRAQEVAQLGSWGRDYTTDETTWSRQLFTLLGMDPDTERASVELFVSALDPDEWARIRREREIKLTDRPKIWSYNIPIRRRDGARRMVRNTVEYTWADDGRLLWSDGTCQDITEQIEAAERVRRSEQLLNRAQELARIGSWEQDHVTGEITWSRQLFTLLGLDPDVDRASYDVFISTIDKEHWPELMRERELTLLERPADRTHDVRLRLNDGTQVVLRNTVEYTWSEDGTLVRSEGTCQDITEQTEAADRLERSERELLESNQHLRQAQQLAGLGSWEHDVATDKVKWSPEMYEMFGLDPNTEEPSSELFFSRLNSDDRKRLREQFSGVLTSRNTSMTADIRITRPDGSERTLHELSEFIWSEDGQLLRQIGTMWDVTEQRAAAERLTRSEALLNRSQELAHIGSWELDAAKGEINWSHNLFAILGADPNADRPSIEFYNSFVHPDDLADVRRRFSDAHKKRPKTATSTTRIIRRDGAVRTLSNILAYFWADDGSMLRMHGTCQDITEQLQAAEQLRRSEQLLNRSQELADIGSWELDGAKGEISWSRNFFAILGADPDVDRPSMELFKSFVHPDDAGAVWQRFDDAQKSQPKSRISNTRIVRRDGAVRTLSNILEYFWADDGSLLRVHGTCQDITEQLQAAERLRRSEQLLNRAQELAHLGSWEHSPVTNEANWSRNYFKILGLDPDMAGTTYESFISAIHPDERAAVTQRFQGMIAGDVRETTYDLRIVRPDGAERTLRYMVEYETADDGTLLRVNGISQDITEQLEAAARLQHNEELLNRAQELAHMGSWEHNQVTGEVNWTRHFFKILGLDPSTDTPSIERFMAVIHPDDQPAIRRRFEAALAGKVSSATYDTRILRGDGTERFLRSIVEYFWDENGVLLRLNGTSQDITEILAAELALKDALAAAQGADKAKSEFVANMSHELRTPLNAIIGFSDMLASDKHSPSMTERDREYAQIIRESGEHLLDIINEVLDFSRIEAGSAEVHDELIETEIVFDWIVKILREKALAKNISLTNEIDSDAREFRGDLRLMRQALLNLASNSVKFTITGEVVLSAGRDMNDDLILVVRDTGIGMRPEDIPAALTPFTLLENTLQRQYQGVGLGFPLAKRFIELHGGKFEVESELQKGTTVTITLPAWRCRDLELAN